MARNDYELTIEDVSRRLNKSVRTIHRYKDSGKLTFVVGATQGNPLFFSASEVEALRQELYPHLEHAAAPVDPAFWQRLERVERVVGMLERNPWLEKLMQTTGESPDPAMQRAMQETLEALAQSDHGELDRKELGRMLIHLGNTLLKS